MKTGPDHRKWIDDRQALADELRQRDAGFVGLAGPFRTIGEKLRQDFNASTAIKHPGDKGTAREGLLRSFLTQHGYLPAKYAVAKGSSHVMSTSGHVSGQIDLLLYDALNSPCLLSMENVQYSPVESCYGTIESKSDINSRETLFDALDKVASFKRLRVWRSDRLVPSDAFGVVVAFRASLAWNTIFEAVREWETEHEPQVWPNLLVVLDRGSIAHAKGKHSALHTDVLRGDGADLHPAALGADTLLNFYLSLVEMLGHVQLVPPPLHRYASLPSTAGEHAYSFWGGAVTETGTCHKHGNYVRKLDERSIARILAACPAGTEVDASGALDAAYGRQFGKPGSMGRVLIYNPDQLPFHHLLVRPAFLVKDGVPFRTGDSIAVDMVRVDGRDYWLPQYYVRRDGLVSECPRCTPIDLSGATVDQWYEAVESYVNGIIASGRSPDDRRTDDGGEAR